MLKVLLPHVLFLNRHVNLLVLFFYLSLFVFFYINSLVSEEDLRHAIKNKKDRLFLSLFLSFI